MAGQKQNGTTVNATISMNAAGLITFTFNDPYSMSIGLGLTSGVNVKASPGDNRFLLDGSTGDTIIGSSGNDLFVFAPGFGADTVTDFDANPVGGQDLIDLTAYHITNFAASVTISGGATAVVTIGGETITLTGVNAANVTSADFIL